MFVFVFVLVFAIVFVNCLVCICKTLSSSTPHFTLYLLSCYSVCAFVFGPCLQAHLYFTLFLSLCICICLLPPQLYTLLRRLPISLSYFYYTLYLYFHLFFFILPSAPYFTCTGLPIWPSNWCLPLLVADITAITVVTLQIYKISLSSIHLYSAQLSKTASAYKWPSIVSYASLSGHTLDHMLPLTAQAFWDCANFLFTWLL